MSFRYYAQCLVLNPLWHHFPLPSPIYLRLSKNFDLLMTFALETHWKLFPEKLQQRTCWPVFRLNTGNSVLHLCLEKSAIWQRKLNWQETFLWNLMRIKKSQTRSLKRDNTAKTEHFIIIYSPSSCSKPVLIFFLSFCWTQNKMFWRIFVAGR